MILMCVVIKVDRDISKIEILANVINEYKKLSRMREFLIYSRFLIGVVGNDKLLG